MHSCDEVFKQLENYDEMTVELLSLTKIGKVMRHIGQKDGIPRQEEFRFQERAKALVGHWVRLLTAGVNDLTKDPGFEKSGSVDLNSPILHDMIRARRRIVSVGGLKEVIVENASGGATSITLPY